MKESLNFPFTREQATFPFSLDQDRVPVSRTLCDVGAAADSLQPLRDAAGVAVGPDVGSRLRRPRLDAEAPRLRQEPPLSHLVGHKRVRACERKCGCYVSRICLSDQCVEPCNKTRILTHMHACTCTLVCCGSLTWIEKSAVQPPHRLVGGGRQLKLDAGGVCLELRREGLGGVGQCILAPLHVVEEEDQRQPVRRPHVPRLHARDERHEAVDERRVEHDVELHALCAATKGILTLEL